MKHVLTVLGVVAFGLALAQTAPSVVNVAPNGNDQSGDGSLGKPFATLAKAASVAVAGQTIKLAAGTYTETKPAVVAPRVSIEGAGEAQTIISSSGVEIAPGVDVKNKDFKLWYDGSVIQLVSAPYPAPNPRYGKPSELLDTVDGSQTLSGFTVEGNRTTKAGVWVENRSNVTMHDVTIRNMKERGAVFAKGDLWWYEALPDGKWMRNTRLYNLTFVNTGTDLADESLGNLNIGGLEGAEIFNIKINDILGYGIKFIYVGHFRNVKIHDCVIRVSERDDKWGEDISIELWNLDKGNEVYNIDANTWFSFVNQWQIVKYLPQGDEAENLKLHDSKIVDLDGLSGKESVELMLAGAQVYNNYFQDKGFGLAVWGVQNPLKNYVIRNNVFANPNRAPRLGFGNSAAVFVPDVATNFKIYNNVFDRMGYGLSLDKARGVDVRNNVFLNSDTLDVYGGQGLTFTNNLKFDTDPKKLKWGVSALQPDASNLLADPMFRRTGDPAMNFYVPSSANSPVLGAGFDTGMFGGAKPFIGAFNLEGKR
jgi:hypothetical protein